MKNDCCNCRKPEEPKLTFTNWITIGSVVAVIFGWFINALIQRRHEIAKERFKVRMEALRSCVAILVLMKETPSPYTITNFKKDLDMANQSMLFYGAKDEVEQWQTIYSLMMKGEGGNAKQLISPLLDLLRRRIRGELRL